MTNQNISNKKLHNAWSDEDVKYLHDNYGKVPNETLEKYLKRNFHTISEYARRHGLKMQRNEDGRTINNLEKPTLRPLLEDGLQGYYWMGYLMADGYMCHNLKQIVLVSAIADYKHLQKYAKFLRAKIHKYTGINGFTKQSYKTCRISVADTINCNKIITLFDWKPRKTYNPPSINILQKTLSNSDHFLAFLIGFIDGDGNIDKYKGTRIENHKSWIKFHNFLLDNLRKMKILESNKKAKINSEGFSKIRITTKATAFLKSFIIKNQLIILSRKWNKVLS